MKTIFKIIVAALCLSAGALSSQTLTPGTTNTTAPCNYTLCRPFNQEDLKQIWQAIMYTSKNQTTTVNNTGTTVISGNVGDLLVKNHYTIPTTSVSYSNGQAVGGMVSFANASKSFPAPVMINDLSIFDQDGNTPELIIDFFQYPYTFTTDHATTDISSNMDKYIGSVLILSSDWVTTGSVSRACINNVNIIQSGVEWNFLITARSACSYPTANGLNVKIGFKQTN